MSPRPKPRMMFYRVQFVAQPEPNQTVLFEFEHPTSRKAVVLSAEVKVLPPKPDIPKPDELEVLAVPYETKNLTEWDSKLRSWVKSAAPNDNWSLISVNVEDMQVLWYPGRAVLYAPTERVEPMLTALAEFAFYEGELRKLEQENAARWPQAESDAPLAYEVTRRNLHQKKLVGERSFQVLQRRIRHVRIELYLFSPAAHISRLGQKLGEQLREKAHIEDRLEILDGQIEVYEDIYEMIGQRMSDYEHFRREFVLELLIVLLLAAEAIILLR